MYHPSSLYGKLTGLLEGDTCICKGTKRRNKPFCGNCYQELRDMDYPSMGKLQYSSGEELLDEIDVAIEELGYNI
jgi:hypothetical protein